MALYILVTEGVCCGQKYIVRRRLSTYTDYEVFVMLLIPNFN